MRNLPFSGATCIRTNLGLDMVTRSVSFRPEDLAGMNPIILLFAPSERSPAYENQVNLLEEDQALRKLDAVFVRNFADGPSYVRQERLDPASADMLRTTYDVGEDDFLLVLLGRDGVEKHRSDAPMQPSVAIERLTDASRKAP